MLSLEVESWTWYSIAAVLLVLRYVSRWMGLGSIKRYQLEDYIMIFVFVRILNPPNLWSNRVFYTVLVITMNIVYHYSTNLIAPEDIPNVRIYRRIHPSTTLSTYRTNLTPESIRTRVVGSKLVLVVEQSMIMTIWGCKACLLCMYMKLTCSKGIQPHETIVKIVAVYVGLSLVAMEVLYFGVWCRPFSNYWAVPTPNGLSFTYP
ncbi:hypothetical protein CJF32_00007900 [Rutstroemia sp. NJR-2017a WRK4]|nr:hypothetical protein CJF32_00007900 [Rutstroemia sp. NJR-2017a WRK4]